MGEVGARDELQMVSTRKMGKRGSGIKGTGVVVCDGAGMLGGRWGRPMRGWSRSRSKRGGFNLVGGGGVHSAWILM